MTFVLTAHPTESRSPENIRLLRRVQGLLVESLDVGRAIDRSALRNLLHLAWRVGTHPPHKPTVEDEAAHLYSLLTDPILEEIIAALARGDRVELRGFGAFSVKHRPARSGRNPRTGETVKVEEKFVPFFKTGKEMRERLNSDTGEND